MVTPPTNLKLIIVIPCLAEAEIIQTLNSLRQNSGFDFNVECLVVVNHSELADGDIKSINKNILGTLMASKSLLDTERLKFIVIEAFNLPAKKTGVGLARKIGMDLAIKRLKEAGSFKDGVIVCLDGDCTVEKNYILEIERYFRETKANGCSIYFEHPLAGENAEAIIDYELFLRYYTNALRWCGYPYAFQTVGSSMAVSALAYEKQGGMNTRKAGEDFYFLTKIIQLGGFGDLVTTTVNPSSRKSERVPFGTGREMTEWEQNKQLLSYCPDLFIELKKVFELVDRFREHENPIALLHENKIHSAFISYFETHELNKNVAEAKFNTSTNEAFRKRFFVWMGAFQIMKLLNELSSSTFQKVPIAVGAAWLWKEISPAGNKPLDAAGLLFQFRKWDKSKKT